jgi:acetyl esterase/lipase
MYLKLWAKKLRGVPILSVDYTLSPEAKFPSALQEILDVYLWATSGDPVVEATLGVRPNRVLICGDSAGANLVASLCLVLNDIRKKGVEPTLLMPKSILAFYPYFCVNQEMSPSFLLSPFCLIVNPFTMSCVLEAYLSKHELTDPEIPWFNRDEVTKQAIFRHLSQFRNNPYLVTTKYQDFDSLSDVSLHIFHPMFCPLLDHSVELAKKWKGPSSLTVFDNCGHGYIQYGLRDEHILTSHSFILNRFQKEMESEN